MLSFALKVKVKFEGLRDGWREGLTGPKESTSQNSGGVLGKFVAFHEWNGLLAFSSFVLNAYAI